MSKVWKTKARELAEKRLSATVDHGAESSGYWLVFEPTGTFVEGRIGSGKLQQFVEANIKPSGKICGSTSEEQ